MARFLRVISVSYHIIQYQMDLKPQQQEAFNAIRGFLYDRNSQIFILKGYAGTGKTTMVKALCDMLHDMEKDFCLMAPTGRAAKVLMDKTGYGASTIHRAIYSSTKPVIMRHDENGKLMPIKCASSRVGNSNGVDQLHLFFAIKEVGHSNSVIIVDEASMISSVKSTNEILHFGTDILLDDLLTFARPRHGAKVIFVGDPAQLPPVGDSRSTALDESYLATLGYGVRTFTLTDILRQSGESIILHNAMTVRQLLESSKRNTLSFRLKEGEVEEIPQTAVVESFLAAQPSPVVGNNIIVCFTNAKVKEYNDHIRQHYFPGNKGVQAGDVLQVVSNNYSLFYDLYNGDFVQVVWASDTVETQSAPVYVERGGKRVRETISLHFRDVRVMTSDGVTLCYKILDDLLNNSEASISPDQHTALYINFLMRHGHIRNNDEMLSSELAKDPYYNALHVKYGYAITGHKSQGGEWRTAYVDYTGRTRLDDASLRWIYTATTRAAERLYGVNIPRATPFMRFTVNPINTVCKPFSTPTAVAADCALLPDTAQPFQKAKCLAVQTALAKLGFSIVSVEAMPYRDRYTINTPQGNVVYDCLYNKKGIYTTYQPKVTNPSFNTNIIEALNTPPTVECEIRYTPPTEALRQLHERMTEACDASGARIVNVTDRLESWCVVYDLKTSGQFAYIQFFVDKNGFVTSAIPSSDLGEEDTVLKTLIQRLDLR